MQPAILFYVSGHGLGHARRAAEVMRALALLRPDVALYVRTTAPQIVFFEVPGVRYSNSNLDSGAVENDALTINPGKTLERAALLLRNADHIVATETAFVRDKAISLIVSDIPFLAGDIATAAGVPCLALSNFTWDWIYEPFLKIHPEYEHVVSRIRESYSKMQVYLRLPFAHDVDIFPEVIDTPLVVRHSLREPNDSRRQVPLPSDDRPRVLVGMRGGVEHTVLATTAAAAKDYLFVVPYEVPFSMPENVKCVAPTAEVSFTDILSACDVVVSKFGYGMLADCVAAKVALVWPRRSGFREDELTEANAPRYIKTKEIPIAAFHAGDWSDSLRAALDMSAAPEEMPLDGAEFCADVIAANIEAESSPS